MAVIQDAKASVAQLTPITSLVLMVVISTALTDLIAAEPITDDELATLYGGWFRNPRCIGGTSCKASTSCPAEFRCCTFCTYIAGRKCKEDWSWVPDLDGCDTDSDNNCPTEILDRGWCYCVGDNCCEVGSCTGSQWDCGGTYQTCDD